MGHYITTQTTQAFPHLDEYKEAMKRTEKRTYEYAARALKAANAAIAKNIHGATGIASWQVNVVRGV